MVTHSSILAWRIPWTEEPGGLYSRCKELGKTNVHGTHIAIKWKSQDFDKVCVP